MSDENEWADSLYNQQLDKYLNLEPFLNQVEKVLTKPDDETASSTPDQSQNEFFNHSPEGHTGFSSALIQSRTTDDRQWIKDLLSREGFSSSSSDDDTSDEDEDEEFSSEKLQEMLLIHLAEKKRQSANSQRSKSMMYVSTGLMSIQDHYYSKPQEEVSPSKAQTVKRKYERKVKEKSKSPEESESEEEIVKDYAQFKSLVLQGKYGAVGPGRPSKKMKKLSAEQMAAKRHKILVALAKKEIPKAQKMKAVARRDTLAQLKKLAKESQKESRKLALASQKHSRDAPVRARRLCKEMLVFWKRFEKVERDHRKKAEKEAYEQRRQDLETLELKRQQRKLNFLITQTELYAHFMAKKMTGNEDKKQDEILDQLKENSESSTDKNGLVDLVGDSYNASEAQQQVLLNASAAFEAQRRHQEQFDQELANPTLSTEAERPQPALMDGKLKEYQLKGMNWLINLYEQGINGILADEMGLGKTVQSIAFMGHLAETYNIWGPFLIVAPASTLHNWQQEVSRFLPAFKVVPYWGNTQDRKVLRLFWNQSNTCSQDSSFHLLVTSYQIVIQDFKYFSKVKWHYMILDEAQAIKSTSSARWKMLLGFNCRNRLLLTGTPIQNTMQELWALLHFIMPTLFDSHEEFSEWFSKDIESSVERQSAIDERHLSRLHMILKPFMLRRLKKDVQDELSDKIERLVPCGLTKRQRLLYQAVKNKIRIEDLLQSGGSSSTSGTQTSSLMNLVMQFRKVCNHPELFERKEIRSPLHIHLPPYHLPKLIFREGILHSCVPSKAHLLFNRFYIHSCDNVHQSSFHNESNSSFVNNSFAFLRCIGLTPMEWQNLMLKGFVVRWLELMKWSNNAALLHHAHTWRSGQHSLANDFLLEPVQTTYFPNVQSSLYLKDLVFSSSTSLVYSHLPCWLHYVPETASHRRIRLKHMPESPASPQHAQLHSPSKHHRRPSGNVASPPPGSTNKVAHNLHRPKDSYSYTPRDPKLLDCMPTEIPKFMYHNMPKVQARLLSSECWDRSAQWLELSRSSQNLESTCLQYGSPDLLQESKHMRFYPAEVQGLSAVRPAFGFSGVYIPDKETLITDAGKLHMLDILLAQLKTEGHRVLIYSQMTRMIDILEEYMWYRKHTYMRLDGSSKISDRRDMVADFQNRSDIFVFLLSTRAGGLGINLTAADTVIFYDSDWNPTVDQQAMDRAHRLGQTKQVTVYRLICTGTIEERILQRAREKSEIQKMVISGGNYRPDVLRPKEVVSLLLDDDEMENKFKLKEAERKRTPGIFGVSVKRKPAAKSGRGRGRPKKQKVVSEINITIPAPREEFGTIPSSEQASREMTPGHSSVLDDSNYSMDSPSAEPSSPTSMVSQEESDVTGASLADDSIPDFPLVVDDKASTASQGSSTPTSVRGKRGRGRPRGSVGRRPRGRGSIQRALSAAEAAAMQAGKSAGYAAYGYSLAGQASVDVTTPVQTPPSPMLLYSRGRGRGRGRWKHKMLH